MQRADAADHLEIMEEEAALFEIIRELNASIQAAEKRGSKKVPGDLEKELQEVRKKGTPPAATKAEEVKAIAGESARQEKQYAYEQKRLEDKIVEDKKTLAEFETKKKDGERL